MNLFNYIYKSPAFNLIQVFDFNYDFSPKMTLLFWEMKTLTMKSPLCTVKGQLGLLLKYSWVTVSTFCR